MPSDGSRRGAGRSIAVVTGSRAKYGLLKSTLTAVTQSSDLALRLIVCGMHLEPAFGQTADAIEADGFAISERIATWTGTDTPEAVAAAISRGVAGFAARLRRRAARHPPPRRRPLRHDRGGAGGAAFRPADCAYPWRRVDRGR